MAGRRHPAVPPLLLLLVLVEVISEAQGSSYLSGFRLRSRLQRDRQMRNVRPNIILILTDDQDIELGKMTYVVVQFCGKTIYPLTKFSCFHVFGFFVIFVIAHLVKSGNQCDYPRF